MIIGIGSDLVDIRRVDATIERYGARFLDRIFTDTERQKSDNESPRASTPFCHAASSPPECANPPLGNAESASCQRSQ